MESSTGVEDNFYTPSNREFYSSNQYSELDSSKLEIRLLELLPVKTDEPLILQLSGPYALSPDSSSFPNYCAVSYVAGNHKNTTAVLVNGIHFNIFTNLAIALRQIIRGRGGLELQGVPQLIWADQICINQSNPAERSHQVGFMRKIFESASVVLGCLGEDQSGGRWVDVAKSLHSEISDYEKTCMKLVRLSQTEIHIANRLFAKLSDGKFQADWKALKGILCSTWWQRGWIYQEILVAGRVFLLFGHGILDWEQFTMAIRVAHGVVVEYVGGLSYGNMEYLDGHIQEALIIGKGVVFAEFMLRARECWQENHEEGIMQLLKHSRACKITDLRDKIFAFSGLADPDYQIVPDYNVDVAGAYRLACKRIILHSMSLDILCYCGEDNRREDLPSWTPDWSSELDHLSVYDPTEDSPSFRASGNYQSTATFRPNSKGVSDGNLRLQCLFIDQLANYDTIGLPVNSSDNCSDAYHSWASIAGAEEEEERKDRSMYPSGNSRTVQEAFWSVLFRGTIEDEPTRNGIDMDKYLASQITETLTAWNFFRSPKGYLGLANQRIQYTDRICILLGANVPFILRQVEDHFEVIGQAYVEGLMYGEAIEIMRRGELGVETIDIY